MCVTLHPFYLIISVVLFLEHWLYCMNWNSTNIYIYCVYMFLFLDIWKVSSLWIAFLEYIPVWKDPVLFCHFFLLPLLTHFTQWKDLFWPMAFSAVCSETKSKLLSWSVCKLIEMCILEYTMTNISSFTCSELTQIHSLGSIMNFTVDGCVCLKRSLNHSLYHYYYTHRNLHPQVRCV